MTENTNTEAIQVPSTKDGGGSNLQRLVSPNGFCYVDITTKGCEGWINLFYDGCCLALIEYPEMASLIKAAIDKESSKSPRMADGTIISLGDEIWMMKEFDNEYPYLRAVKETVNGMYIGDTIGHGNVMIMTENWEGGNLECYRTKEDVPCEG